MKNILKSAALLLSTCIVQNTYAQCTMNEEGYANVSGSYICTTVCQAEGKTAYVTQKGDQLLFINEMLEKGAGVIWKLQGTAGELTFKVTNNCQQIEFSNNTVWIRK